MVVGWLPSGAAWGPGVVVTAACAALGLVAHRVVARDRAAHFLGPQAAIAGSVFHLAMLGVVFVAVSPDELRMYWLETREGSIGASFAIPAIVVCAAVALLWSRWPPLRGSQPRPIRVRTTHRVVGYR